MTAAQRIDPTNDADPVGRRLETRQGTSAQVDDHTVEVRTGRGCLLFRYDEVTGAAAIFAPDGDLSLCAPRGQVEIVAAHGVRCASAGPVAIESATAVRLATRVDAGAPATLELRERGVRLRSDRLTLAARRADLLLHEARYRGEELDVVMDRAHLVVDELSSTARQVICRARDVVERVERLRDTRVGRWRAVIDGALDVLAESTLIEAKDDVRIDGYKIHLG